jgi:hypothetical protein
MHFYYDGKKMEITKFYELFEAIEQAESAV